jgi:hypothetical protein
MPEEFLTKVIGSGQTIRLSSLEVVWGPSDNDIDMCGTLSSFLGAFQGLEDLFASLPGPVETLELWRSIIHHKFNPYQIRLSSKDSEPR